jgi:hypothetical protein
MPRHARHHHHGPTRGELVAMVAVFAVTTVGFVALGIVSFTTAIP